MYNDNPSQASGKRPAQAEMGRISRFKSFIGFKRLEKGGITDSDELTPIGVGFASVICKAYDRRLGIDVAVKIALDDEAALYTLRNEERILRKFGHPNVVKYLGSGEFKEGDFAGHAYLEMEYLVGQTLKARLRQGTLGWEETRGIIISICDALQAVHEAGIIHRDVKPDNIFLAGDGAKLLDFGVARPPGLRGLLSLSFEQGDANYTAPEGFLSKFIAQSDQYSVGAMIYEALSGRPPYTGNDIFGFLHGTISGPATLAPYCPEAICDTVEGIVMRALSRDPKSRFPSMAMMKAAIEEISG